MLDIDNLPEKNCGDIVGHLLTDSQDIEALLDSLGCNLLDITGAIVKTAHGDYVDVWLTQSARPYHIESRYFQLPLKG